MILRREERLLDLEYLIPKEYKEEIEEADRAEEIEGHIEACYLCGSTEGMLIHVVEEGERRLVCLRCLKKRMEEQNTWEPQNAWNSESNNDVPSGMAAMFG